MPTVTRTFTVTSTPRAVLAYLKDFNHAEEWDPGTKTCTRSDAGGAIAVGATWHNVSKIAGITTELSYTLEQLTDERIVLVGRNDTATSTDTITVTPRAGGSEITYHSDIALHGAAALASPAVKLVFEKIGNDTRKQMKIVLDHLD